MDILGGTLLYFAFLLSFLLSCFGWGMGIGVRESDESDEAFENQ